MGILTKEVEVKINSSNIRHFKDLGYNIPMRKASDRYAKEHGVELVYDLGAPMIVKVDDLGKNSSAFVDVLCDMCKEKILNVRYADYNKVVDRTGSYVCRECSYIKTQQTLIANYGDLYVNTEEFKEKQKRVFIEKYGVDNPFGSKEIREKIRKSNIEKYGYAHIGQVPEFREKMKATLMEHYGVDAPSKSEKVKEKIRNTNLERYGVPSVMQFPEIKEKANRTLCENGNQKTSKQQLYLHNLYGGELNYPIKRYAVDICFLEEMLYIEYDGGGHNLVVRHGDFTQEEFHQKEIVRHCIIKREGYNEMRIISSKDLLPCDDILLQMLNEARQYFLDYTNHSWIEFNIDTSTVRNAENKDGIPYDFGSLRTIKDNDIQNIELQTNMKGA